MKIKCHWFACKYARKKLSKKAWWPQFGQHAQQLHGFVCCALNRSGHTTCKPERLPPHGCFMQPKRNWHRQRTWRDRQAVLRGMDRTLEGVNAVLVAGHLGGSAVTGVTRVNDAEPVLLAPPAAQADA